jgi:hypothetical protein
MRSRKSAGDEVRLITYVIERVMVGIRWVWRLHIWYDSLEESVSNSPMVDDTESRERRTQSQVGVGKTIEEFDSRKSLAFTRAAEFFSHKKT